MTTDNSIQPDVKKFASQNATRYMRGGGSEYCQCGHSYYEHRKGHRTFWFDPMYGKRVIPACIKCNCEEFVSYRHASREVIRS
jgi:hypothetical protein